MAEKKFKGGVPEPFDLGGVQVHCHAIADRLGTCCNRRVSAFDFHKAETAGSKRRNGLSYGA